MTRDENGLAILAEDVTKGFRTLLRSTEIIRGVSLEIEDGEIFGILGPNGSGKTTLLSLFSTLIYPDGGSLRVLGLDARTKTHAIRKIINISTGKPNFPWSLTVKENLRHSGMLYGLHGKDLARSVGESMETLELEEYQDVRFENLSTGIKQRLSLARALLNRPRLLFLDEPTTGLDPEIAIKTREMVRRIHEEQGISVVLTTHYMPEAEELCERVAFLRKGRVVAMDTPANLKKTLKLGERMAIRYRGSVNPKALEALPGVLSLSLGPGRVELVIDRREDSISRIMKIFSGTEILDIRLDEPDLEDVFLELAR